MSDWNVKLPVSMEFDVRLELDAQDGEGAVELAWDRLEGLQAAFRKALDDEGFRLVSKTQSPADRARALLIECRRGTVEEAEPA